MRNRSTALLSRLSGLPLGAVDSWLRMPPFWTTMSGAPDAPSPTTRLPVGPLRRTVNPAPIVRLRARAADGAHVQADGRTAVVVVHDDVVVGRGNRRGGGQGQLARTEVAAVPQSLVPLLAHVRVRGWRNVAWIVWSATTAGNT